MYVIYAHGLINTLNSKWQGWSKNHEEKKFKPEKSLRLKSYLLHIPKNYDIIEDDLPKNVGPILCGDINELILANRFACISFKNFGSM